MKKNSIIISVILLTLIAGTGCKKSTTTTTTTPPAATLPAMYSKFSAALQIYVEGNYVVIKSTGIPDHKSPYFQPTDARYEAYNGTNPAFVLNPNRIMAQTITFKIPITPAESPTKPATPLGPIGVAINGIPVFNQYAGPGTPLTNEINSFDQYNGHPQQSGSYHYHVEPKYITTQKGRSALLGVLLDGYPVYGPMENGVILTSSNLDAYHGHSTATAEFPGGIYHYHTTADAPYINGSGFFGVPGTVTQ